MLVGRGLAVVLGDLAEMGYDERWGIVGADDAIWTHCAPCVDHERARLWILANANADSLRELQQEGRIGNERGRVGDGCEAVPNSVRFGLQGSRELVRPGYSKEDADWQAGRVINGCKGGEGWWNTEPNLGGMADGLASPLDIHGAHAAGNVARVGVRIPKRADRLRCIGNGQVPAALVLAWRILNQQ